jgi:hypothetical protein
MRPRRWHREGASTMHCAQPTHDRAALVFRDQDFGRFNGDYHFSALGEA